MKFPSRLVFLLLLISIPFSLTQYSELYGQTMQDISCPSCVKISSDEIELYKELFPIIIWTDDYIYDHQSIVTVNGYLKPENAQNPVTILVTNPLGNLVTVEQVTPAPSGDFTLKFNTESTLWSQDGTYIIKAQSGSEGRSFKTDIELIPLDLGTTSKCNTTMITVFADNGGTYCVPFEVSGELEGIEGMLSIESKTLLLNVRSTNVEFIFVDLPRHLLNAKTDAGQDSPFIILVNGEEREFEEQTSNLENHRRLAILFPPDREGTIEIIGTSAIPEFGSIAVLVLVSATIAIIVASHRFLGVQKSGLYNH